ncbi:MAG: hypothetical protein WD944_09660 [Steroidobacteraceae bacterium]
MSSIDEAVEVRTSEEIDAARLGAYLAEHLARLLRTVGHQAIRGRILEPSAIC